MLGLRPTHEVDWYGPVHQVYGVDLQGNTTFAACGDSMVRLWDSRSGGLEHTIAASRHGSVRCIQTDGWWLATGSADGVVRVFDQRTMTSIKVIRYTGLWSNPADKKLFFQGTVNPGSRMRCDRISIASSESSIDQIAIEIEMIRNFTQSQS